MHRSFIISEEEKKKILIQHQNATSSLYLNLNEDTETISLDNIQVTPLFSVPLYTNILMLTEDEKQFFREQPYVRMSSDNGFYTQDKKILENPSLLRYSKILGNLWGYKY
jgi:hypothetical protein